MSAPDSSVALFRLGHIVTTPNALGKLTQQDVLTAVQRHQVGDWGSLAEKENVGRTPVERPITTGALWDQVPARQSLF